MAQSGFDATALRVEGAVTSAGFCRLTFAPGTGVMSVRGVFQKKLRIRTNATSRADLVVDCFMVLAFLLETCFPSTTGLRKRGYRKRSLSQVPVAAGNRLSR